MRHLFLSIMLFIAVLWGGCTDLSSGDKALPSDAQLIANEMETLDFSLFDEAWQNLAGETYNIQVSTLDSAFTVTENSENEFDLRNNPLPHFYPDEPSFLATRGRENYLFTKTDDSTQVKYTVSSNPSAGGLNVITKVEILVNKTNNKVIYLALTRNQQSQFFTEKGTYEAEVGRSIKGLWLPKKWAFDVVIGLPFQDEMKSRLLAEYVAE